LIFETRRGDSEVNQSYLNADFRKVMRVLQFGSDEEFKVRTDSDPSISKFNGVLSRYFTDILGQERLEGRIEFLLNVLDHNRVTSRKADFDNL
jgi:hypothetical protein